jgi:hypothetical protein
MSSERLSCFCVNSLVGKDARTLNASWNKRRGERVRAAFFVLVFDSGGGGLARPNWRDLCH